MPDAVKVTGLPLGTAALAVTVLLLLPAPEPRVQLVKVAIPLTSVVRIAGLAGTIDPPPPVTVNVTDTPETGFPPTSVTFTEGGAATAVLTVALWETAELAAMVFAAPTVPEALNVTGLPLGTVAEADTVLLLLPAPEPRVQLVKVAIPLTSVVRIAGLAGTIDPPPPVTVNVTDTPETGFPPTSVTFTEGGAATAVLTVALWETAELAAMVFAAPTVPEALNVTGLPLGTVAEADTVLLLLPTVDPKVQLVSVATPLTSVVRIAGLAGTIDPPPPVTVNVTDTPETGFPPTSVTFTEGGAATAVLTVALWETAELAAMVFAAPTVPEALNVTGLPLGTVAEADTVLLLLPTVDPKVQLVSVATPLTSVVRIAGLAGTIDPPPPVTVNVTDTPETGFPPTSVTFTEGGAATAVLTVALWETAELAAMVFAAPTVPEALNVTGLPLGTVAEADTVLLLLPTVDPKVQLVSVATPLTSVVRIAGLAGTIDPPPPVTVNVTDTPETGFPPTSVTFTEGGAATAVLTVALWETAELAAMVFAAPTVPEALNVTGLPLGTVAEADTVLLLLPTVDPKVQLVSVATPLTSVVRIAGLAGTIDPPPPVTVNVTDTPETGFPPTSVTFTEGGAATAVLTVALWETAELAAMVFAAPTVPEALNVTGLPLGTVAEADTVLLLLPTVDPKVQLVSVATPLTSVVRIAGLAGTIDPPPPVTVNVTDTPETGFPPTSVTFTEGGAATAVLTVALWETAELAAMVFAAPTVPEALNVTGLPLGTVAEADTVLLLLPAPEPRVQLVKVAIPLTSVVRIAGLAGTIDPPPPVTVNVTDTPETGFPPTSVTFTEGGAATAVLTVALWETAELAAMVFAAPTVPEALNVTGLPLGTVAEADTVLLLLPTVDPKVQLVSVATPLTSVVRIAGLAGTIDPPPPVTVNVTDTPETGFPPTSVTFTEGGAATAVLTVALWETAELAAMVFAAPTVPEALNVTGLPLGTVAEADTVLLLLPTVDPKVQLVSVATPLTSVVRIAGLAGTIDPPPPVTVNVTDTPETGFPPTSVTFTEGGAATAVLTVALWETAELAAMVFAGPAVLEAVNVTGLPLGTAAVAVRVLLLVPAVFPRVQLMSEAMPEALVLTLAGLTGEVEPAPPVTVKVTPIPATGLPKVSVIFTEGAVTCVPTVPL